MELMARSVFGEIALSSARASLDFWRTHGSESGRQAVGARRALVQERATTNYLDDAAAQALRAQPAERFARFGEIVASGAGFDQWMVAIADGARVVAGRFFFHPCRGISLLKKAACSRRVSAAIS